MRLKIYLDVMPAEFLAAYRGNFAMSVLRTSRLPRLGLMLRILQNPSASYDGLRIKVRTSVRNVAPALPIFLPFIHKARIVTGFRC
jgi:hypothetical protein